MSRADRFLNACHRQAVDTTPIWLMRQAGRYMPVYRALRQKYGILDLIRAPELACEVTLQPVDAFEVDAAIIFADILPLPAAMGLDLEFIKGEGPVFHNPVTSPADVDRLLDIDPAEELSFTIEAVRCTRQALDGRVPLIGFSGAPFTLACYAVQGEGSRTFDRALAFLREQPEAWHRLMEKLSTAVIGYLRAQVEAGAQALQFFDSWAGHLSPEQYRSHVLPYSRRVFEELGDVGVPLIHFSTGDINFLRGVKEAGGDVISIDARHDIGTAWAELGFDTAVQGNLDPELLASGTEEDILAAAQGVLDSAGGRPGHIFNLGHGVLKTTPEAQVQALIDFVHQAGARD